MKKAIVAVVGLLFLAGQAHAVEIKSKAEQIKITGRVHTQFNSSSVRGTLGSEFLIRRARLTAEVELNDFVSGKVQPDYGKGKLSLKDAYMKLTYGRNLTFRLGQFKRPFDLFELTSSTRILVVERDGDVRGVSGFTSFSSFTEELEYSDRDIGVEARIRDNSKRFQATVAVTNGIGANKVPHKKAEAVSEKQYTGRIQVKPSGVRNLTLALGATARPYAVSPATGNAWAGSGVVSPDVNYASALELGVEWGTFKSGAHVQAGVVTGDNWAANTLDPPTLFTGQVIGTYKVRVEHNAYVEAVEPLFRVSYADPNTSVADDGGLLFTPGIQVFFVGRNKIALNVDIFVPEASNADTEYSLKIQSSLHF